MLPTLSSVQYEKREGKMQSEGEMALGIGVGELSTWFRDGAVFPSDCCSTGGRSGPQTQPGPIGVWRTMERKKQSGKITPRNEEEIFCY